MSYFHKLFNEDHGEHKVESSESFHARNINIALKLG